MYKVVSYYCEDPKLIQEFHDRSRYLWTDHMLYTRNTIISIINGLGDTAAQSNRLLKNQEDLGSMMSPYYDQSDVDQFVYLLKEHINIAAQLATAAKVAQDSSTIMDAWKANENDIIQFMSTINPMGWPDFKIRPIWDEHLNMTAGQIVEYVAGRWLEDIAAIDANHGCLMRLADVFSKGIIEQNIENFCMT